VRTKRGSSPNWYRLAFSRTADRDLRRQAWKAILVAELTVGVVVFATIYALMAATDYATWSVVALGVFTVTYLGVLVYVHRDTRWHD
jgi:O-antigen/teichoic acid export membrane protein